MESLSFISIQLRLLNTQIESSRRNQVKNEFFHKNKVHSARVTQPSDE